MRSSLGLSKRLCPDSYAWMPLVLGSSLPCRASCLIIGCFRLESRNGLLATDVVALYSALLQEMEVSRGLCLTITFVPAPRSPGVSPAWRGRLEMFSVCSAQGMEQRGRLGGGGSG